MTDPRLPDKYTTRRIVTDFFIEYKHLLKEPVLEVGSARPEGSWWADIRSQVGFADKEWTGVDMQDSPHTDVVVDITDDLAVEGMWNMFNSCVCAETLEHVQDPHMALENIGLTLAPGAWILISTPFAFPVHGFPNDYWRFTPAGLGLLLRDAGFEDVAAMERETEPFYYHDHVAKLSDYRRRDLPASVCAIARKP